MSEAQTPEEETIETDLAQTPDEDVPIEDEYDGMDPEDDAKVTVRTRFKEPKRPELQGRSRAVGSTRSAEP